MGYAGEILDQCGLINIDCTKVTVVAVSGDGPNVCGHLLIQTGSGSNKYYFHVAEFHNYPRYMSEAGYRRYLSDSGKTEIRRISLTLPNPDAAAMYLEELTANTWTWLAIPNNCVAFVEEVIAAGGGTWSSYSNCPSVATQDSITTRVNRFLNTLEGEIYRSYGVPGF